MNSVDPLTLQRLIDGECSTDEVRSALAAVEQCPHHWQTIALALIEDRSWQRNFLNETPRAQLTIDSETKSSVQFQSCPDSSIAVRSPTAPSMVRLNGLALAASALLAAMLGYLAGQNFSTTEPAREFLADGGNSNSVSQGLENQVAAVPSATPEITPASLKADYHLQLPDDDRSNLSGEIPLYDVQSMEQWNQLNQPIRNQFHMTPEMLADLKARGMRVRQDVKYLSGSLQDGRKFVVPIRSINFSPVQ